MNNLNLEPSDVPFLARIIGRSIEIVRRVRLSEKSELTTVLHLRIREALELRVKQNEEFKEKVKEIFSKEIAH